MGPKRWIDRKNADTYALVHRSQQDPLYNDSDAPERVLMKLDNLNGKESKTERKTKWKQKAESSLGNDSQEAREVRGNEGEALVYGITFDDSKYDYMQHLRIIGEDPSAVYVNRKDLNTEKSNVTGELMLKSDYAQANNASVALPTDVLPSTEVIKKTYQDQQNLPDSIAGLQPDMDPNLREVLEALEDEAYIEEEYMDTKQNKKDSKKLDAGDIKKDNDDDDDDIFSELVKSGAFEEDDKNEWDEFDANDYSDFDSGDEDYDSDDTIVKSKSGMRRKNNEIHVERKEGEEDWEVEFRKFKIQQERTKREEHDSEDEFESEAGDKVGSLSQITSATTRTRKKKGRRGGARTEISGLSMTSSALFRNEGLTLLDDRFDKIDNEYGNGAENDDDGAEFDLSKERNDFESAMDSFLNDYYIDGKKMYKK